MNARFTIPVLTTFLGLVALSAACSSSSGATDEPKKICTPGNDYYCKCVGQGEGQRTCNDDGMSFGACEPCDEEIEPEVDSGVVECGDGIVQEGEDCDDKNDNDDDGCSSQCRLSGTDPPPSRSCPGLDVHVWEDPVEYEGSTAGSPNSSRGTPGCKSTTDDGVTGSTAADRIFRVTAHKAGTMSVTTTDTDFNNWLYMATSCAATNAYVTCSNEVAGKGGEKISFPVENGKVYTVIVDGVLADQGAFRIKFAVE